MSFINDNFKVASIDLTIAAAGPLGTAAATVDIASSFNVKYSGAANGAIVVPTPTDVQAGDRAFIANVGVIPFSVLGETVNGGFMTIIHWSGTAWILLDGGRNAGVSVPVAAVAAGNFIVTHNLGMPTSLFSSVLFRAYNTLGNEVVFKRNKAADTANALGFSSPVVISTNLPITFDFSPLA